MGHRGKLLSNCAKRYATGSWIHSGFTVEGEVNQKQRLHVLNKE